ncbi:VOC family protein [Sphaerisporangium sp. TRM90804]|uniref:VOC family protein n=1 Tax=Sphaerisporangium sp. TRM90804 TaxID=3031113 RepID=UPI002446BC5F|nr:VOC family protein [Sphaerisporangium sp. TRM90804]MDH2430503.1 glyoxalase/bleomycin resistance/extradiol dioxygenase family protein [Sphaerisporangium sp. TRM90804]
MKTFINLPVRDLSRTIAFFSRLGLSFDPQAAGEETACMLISDDACVMLHTRESFALFTGKAVTDTSTSREVIVGLSADSREQVDELVDKAVAAGAQPMGASQNQDYMYMRGFCDLDGHQWSFLYMSM